MRLNIRGGKRIEINDRSITHRHPRKMRQTDDGSEKTLFKDIRSLWSPKALFERFFYCKLLFFNPFTSIFYSISNYNIF